MPVVPSAAVAGPVAGPFHVPSTRRSQTVAAYAIPGLGPPFVPEVARRPEATAVVSSVVAVRVAVPAKARAPAPLLAGAPVT